MTAMAPDVVLLAGPNGAGKSTTAPLLLRDVLKVTEFVNADVIAQGLSAFEPERAALTAGRIMLARLRELARQRVSFAFETTLASRSFAPWIASLKEKDAYRFRLIFLWLPSPDVAVARVAERVRAGGHDAPEETIRRRYETGLKNFFSIDRPLANEWRVYDNSRIGHSILMAAGEGPEERSVVDRLTWERIKERYSV
jgi:predicted ABC-type ATPase